MICLQSTQKNIILPSPSDNNTGQMVVQAQNQKTINTSALNSGIYFYRITQNGEILSSGKWVKR
ncbi:MAG: T9SS type A sorting domain-containing protein [Bacteroidales bacterium]|nr:T9SS type A sorting domain-containing protein [Bacteroidales bacterium]